METFTTLLMILTGLVFLVLGFASKTRIKGALDRRNPGRPINIPGRVIFVILAAILLVTGIRRLI